MTGAVPLTVVTVPPVAVVGAQAEPLYARTCPLAAPMAFSLAAVTALFLMLVVSTPSVASVMVLVLQVTANEMQYPLVFDFSCYPRHEDVVVDSVKEFGNVEFRRPEQSLNNCPPKWY
jgi:hypothetical protein